MAIRLIDTKALRMKMFVGACVPPYAILSHTWVEGEEVDFQEMTRYGAIPRQDDPSDSRQRDCRCSGAAATDTTADDIRRRSGYQKILQTCRLAREKGLNWAWVDTCCIDKSSSAELSEAINSMFNWYANAVQCYALLSDLEPNVKNLREALGHCRWFTRGWTLQELIAPVQLEFYNRTWEKIGSKDSLQAELADITGVDEGVLASGSRSLGDWDVATKMFWASRRQTTRTEDMAYCLLGLFEINMPLLYGEGDKAFRRLQEEILRRVDDDSIFCTSASGDEPFKPHRAVLARSPAQFRWRTYWLSDHLADRPRTAFTMTNRGLLVQNPCLIPFNRPLIEEPLYVLEMNYTVNNNDDPAVGDGAVLLTRVGQGRYVRLSMPGPPDTDAIVKWRFHCLRKAALMEDFCIVNPALYLWTSFYDQPNVRWGSCLQLEPVLPPHQLSVVKPGPSRFWDVAGMRADGLGLRWATLELTTYTGLLTHGHLTLASFHITVVLDRRSVDGLKVQLYSSDEWKTVASSFEGDGGDWRGRTSSFTELQEGDVSSWLCLGPGFVAHRGNGRAPLRVRVRVAASGRIFSFADVSTEIKLEAEFLQEDGRYSSDFSGWAKLRREIEMRTNKL